MLCASLLGGPFLDARRSPQRKGIGLSRPLNVQSPQGNIKNAGGIFFLEGGVTRHCFSPFCQTFFLTDLSERIVPCLLSHTKLFRNN